MVFGVNSILKRIQAMRAARNEARIKQEAEKKWGKFESATRRYARGKTTPDFSVGRAELLKKRKH
jgi:hypothetical protein